MTHREGRHRYQSEARQPREVTNDMRMRCLLAVAKREADLSETDKAALRVVSDAYAAMAFVTKADIDRANGILGRLNANG